MLFYIFILETIGIDMYAIRVFACAAGVGMTKSGFPGFVTDVLQMHVA